MKLFRFTRRQKKIKKYLLRLNSKNIQVEVYEVTNEKEKYYNACIRKEYGKFNPQSKEIPIYRHTTLDHIQEVLWGMKIKRRNN